MNTLQDDFLKKKKEKKQKVKIYTINGVPITGELVGYDRFTVIVQNEKGKKQLLYKHAISTIE